MLKSMTHDPESALLPCPWCGGAARMDRLAHKETHGYDSYSPECASCGTSLLPAEDIPTHELAVAAWNHRVPDPRLAAFDEVVKALRQCREQFSTYEHNHLVKGTADGDEKAHTNYQFKNMCDIALGEYDDAAALAHVRELESK